MTLSSIQPAHIESIRLWRNAQMNVLRQNEPITFQDQQAYFAARIWPAMEKARPDNILLACHLDSLLIGYGGLVHIAWEDSRAEVSFLVQPELAADPDRYEELFSSYLTLLPQLAFDDLGLHRLVTETWSTRADHLAVLEAAGFVREGLLREHTRQNGIPTDSLIHGLLATDVEAR